MLGKALFGSFVVAFAASLCPAAVIWNFSNPPADPPTIAQVMQAGGIQVGDKLFEFTSVVTTKTVGTVAPGADAIKVSGVRYAGQGPDGWEYGLCFNGGWSAGGQQIADTTIHFSMMILEPWLSQGWRIKDNALWISAFGVSGTGEGGIVSVSENVYAQDPALYPPAPGGNVPIANKFVYYRNDADMELYEEADFTGLTKIWIIKDIVANGGNLQTGAAHLSEFYQTFSQVPEPATMAVLAIGGGLLLLRRRRA